MTDGNWQKENGFEFDLFPAKSEKPTSLVIYMHGVGDNARGFAHYAAAIQDKIPGADVIALQAPIRFEDPDIPAGEEGYTWFPYGGKVMPQVKTWLAHIFNRLPVAGKVEAFARAQLEKRGLDNSALAFAGHSMGAIVALETGLSAKKAIAAVASLGGTVAPFTKVKSKPDVFLQMGGWDDVFNEDAPRLPKAMLKRAFVKAADKLSLRHGRAVERLQKKGVPFTEKIYEGQGHMLDRDAFADTADFIAAALAKRRAPKA